ncbi:MAG: hypothetical protein DHS20C17_23910 [Cyclobacteriaceae bacterium]|nr:MAG: hypothetical protein DHS20C17_23910 [Cyclobacteriaceae bacterium]
MGKSEFEKVWRDTFDGAEAEPSDRLWVGIEAGIANEEAARFRRGMAFYRWVAAAGVILVAGFIGYMALDSQHSGQLARHESDVKQEETGQSPIGSIPQTQNPDKVESAGKVESAIEEDNSQDYHSQQLNASGRNTEEPTRSTPNSSSSTTVKNQNILDDQKNSAGQVSQVSPLTASPSGDTQNLGYQNARNEATDVKRNIDQLVQVKGRHESTLEALSLPEPSENVIGVVVFPNKESSPGSRLWAGLNMAPGYFDPNYNVQNGTAANALASPGSTAFSNPSIGEQHNSGLSMSIGMEMGMRISDRWQLSSGLQYLNNSIQSSTNLVIDNTPVFSSTIESLDLSESRLSDVSYEPAELDNTFQFLSVPVLAGYLVVDRKVKLLLNAGIASDFFLKNRISAVDQTLESVTINPGSSAPFRSVYFNGLLGAQASYEILPRYLVTLEPRYKLAITDFTRPEVSYTSSPSSFGVGVGIKYVFK